MKATFRPPTSDDHARGSADAAITVVQYGDYDCPHTRAAQAVIHGLMGDADYGLRWIYRQFPLRHLHPNAELLSEIAEAAALQGKFWEMHDHLMSHRRAIRSEDLLEDARAAGVDWERLKADLAKEAVKARVQADVDGGKAAGVHSTPSFFFNGVLHDGHYDKATLEEQLRKARGQ